MNHVFCQFIKIDELDAIKITHPLFHATLLLQGAQLIEFSPRRNKFNNLLWLSNTAQYKHGKSIRGGIPICWPWFGNLEKNPDAIQQQVNNRLIQDSAPAHGLVRDIPWNINTIEEDCEKVIIELIITSNELTSDFWPYDFSLKARFTLSQKLELDLITNNTGTTPFSFSQALHTYLPTEDISKTYIHNAHQAKYLDALDDWKEKIQLGRVAFNQETDRLYFFKNTLNGDQFELRAESPNRQINLKTENSLSAVIWNPWIEKSLRLSQFSPLDYKSMFCIESANVMRDYKYLETNEQNSISLTLTTV